MNYFTQPYSTNRQCAYERKAQMHNVHIYFLLNNQNSISSWTADWNSLNIYFLLNFGLNQAGKKTCGNAQYTNDGRHPRCIIEYRVSLYLRILYGEKFILPLWKTYNT